MGKTKLFFLLLLLLALVAIFTTAFFFLLKNEKKADEVETNYGLKRTCPKCYHGNFLEKNKFLELSWFFHSYRYFNRYNLRCDWTPEMEECETSCLIIVLNKKVGRELPYEGLAMTCASNYNVEKDWPANLPRPKGRINETLSFSKMVEDYQVSYIYHKTQYKKDNVFQHVLDFGFPYVARVPLSNKDPNTISPIYYVSVSIALVIFLVLLMLRICCMESLTDIWNSKNRKQMKMCENGGNIEMQENVNRQFNHTRHPDLQEPPKHYENIESNSQSSGTFQMCNDISPIATDS